MRTSSRLTALAAGLVLAGCATSRPDADRQPVDEPQAPAAQAEASGPARVGLAATMDVPDNPYGDTAIVDLPTPDEIASGAVPLGTTESGEVDPSTITVGRYYYDDEGTTYYDDVAADLDDDGQGADDYYYYGGYYADYYRYGDPAYYPSPYTYYRPYATYRPYVRYGWYPTWRHRRYWARAYYYDPYGYDPYSYDPYYAGAYYDPYWYGPGVTVSIGWGWGGYGYGSGYRHGYYDGYVDGSYAGYYGPGYYGRPRSRGYDTFRDEGRGGDDGRRSRIRGLPGTSSSPVAQSSPDPARQPARRGLSPAHLPSRTDPAPVRRTDPGITRSTGRRATRGTDPATETTRGWQPDRATRTASISRRRLGIVWVRWAALPHRPCVSVLRRRRARPSSVKLPLM